MAAPTIRSSLIPAIFTNGSLTQSVASSTAVDDLIIFFVWAQGADQSTLTLTAQSGFFDWFNFGHNDGTTDGRYQVVVKKVTVAGAQSYTPSVAANATANQISMGHIVLQAGTYQSNLNSVVPPATSGPLTSTNTAAPNPGQVTGLTGDFLVFAIGCWHVTTAGSTQATPMANYTIEIQNANASHVTHLSVARRALTGLSASSEDPAVYTDNVAPNGAVSNTIAISGYVTKTITAGLDARVEPGTTTVTITTSINAVVQTARTATASVDAIVQSARNATASNDAVVQSAGTITVGLDARISDGSTTIEITAAVDAVVQQAGRTVVGSTDAVVQQGGRTAAASVDTIVRGTQTIAASLDVVVQAGQTLSTSIDAHVEVGSGGTYGITTSIDAYVATPIPDSAWGDVRWIMRRTS